MRGMWSTCKIDKKDKKANETIHLGNPGKASFAFFIFLILSHQEDPLL